MIFIWAVFAIHLPLSLLMDDACYTADLYINDPSNAPVEFQILVKCLEADVFSDTLRDISDEMRSKFLYFIYLFIFLFFIFYFLLSFYLFSFFFLKIILEDSFNQINAFTTANSGTGYTPTNAQTVNSGNSYRDLLANLATAQRVIDSVNQDVSNGASKKK
jgi:hypothetical protein